MSKKIYLIFLILCCIFSQGIFGTFLENDDEVSSKLLSRKKRVIDNLPGNELPYTVADLFYIVKVVHKLLYICNGIIVSPKHILTGRICPEKAKAIEELHVETGDVTMGPLYMSAYFVLRVIKEGDLALLELHSRIFETTYWHRRIELDYESLPKSSTVIIAGWGLMGKIYRRRATKMKIIDKLTCQTFFEDHIRYKVTKNHICTIELSGARGCTHEDGGAALVHEGKLVGVLIFAGTDLPNQRRPDVFIRVNAENGYYNWIMSNIRPFLNPANGSNRLPYLYIEQQQTLYYRAGQKNLFVHPHPAHFSHHRPNPPPAPVVHV